VAAEKGEWDHGIKCEFAMCIFFFFTERQKEKDSKYKKP